MLGFGCDKKKDAAPPPATGMPPLDQPAAAAPPGDHPVHAPEASGQNLPAGHPPVLGGSGGTMGGAPASGGFQGTTPGGDFDPKTVLSGVIKLDGKLKSKVAPGDVIFLVARKFDASGAPGIPLAVKKLTVSKFPLEFELDSRDAMMAGTQLAGKVVVTARVDKDGDAMSKNPGDVTGQSKPLEPPQKNVVVDLDKVL
jgi:hypothetical protein